MDPAITTKAFDLAMEYKLLGVLLFFAVAALAVIVWRSSKECRRDREKLVDVLETTVKDNASAHNNLADAIRGSPCRQWAQEQFGQKRV